MNTADGGTNKRGEREEELKVNPYHLGDQPLSEEGTHTHRHSQIIRVLPPTLFAYFPSPPRACPYPYTMTFCSVKLCMKSLHLSLSLSLALLLPVLLVSLHKMRLLVKMCTLFNLGKLSQSLS